MIVIVAAASPCESSSGAHAALRPGIVSPDTVAMPRAWLRRAAVTSLAVLSVTLLCLGHLALMPRIEVLLRGHTVLGKLSYWSDAHRDGRAVDDEYETGRGRARFNAVEHPAPGAEAVVAYTPVPLRRWTLFGYVDSCYIVLNAAGEGQIVPFSEGLDQVLAHGVPLRPAPARPHDPDARRSGQPNQP